MGLSKQPVAAAQGRPRVEVRKTTWRDVAIVAAGMGAIAALAVNSLLGSPPGPSAEAVAQAQADRVPAPVLYRPDPADVFWERIGDDIAELSDALLEPARGRELRALADAVLEHAAQAVAEGDEPRLGASLSLMGQFAIEEQDFDAAAVYLAEALEVFEALGDEVGAARVKLHTGRMHLKLRQRARTAGQAYDRLLLARWQIVHGQFAAAEENLEVVVEENLSINRFGAAASALATRARLYREAGEPALAGQAVADAAGLYAAAGQMGQARAQLVRLTDDGAPEDEVMRVAADIETRYSEFEASVAQVGAAADYQRLYSFYLSRGDRASAWRLRLRARDSLGAVSRREMYQRIPDVMALLYVSNENAAQAQSHFDSALQVFELRGLTELGDEAAQLKGDVI